MLLLFFPCVFFTVLSIAVKPVFHLIYYNNVIYWDVATEIWVSLNYVPDLMGSTINMHYVSVLVWKYSSSETGSEWKKGIER
jgi:hypothetical protein